MGTRADFYIGRGIEAEWLGSIAWDGYPSGIDDAVLAATTEDVYRANVADFLTREDGTLPEMGWPWPWDTSSTTDYAYALDGGVVYASCFGAEWFVATADGPSAGAKTAEFPDMSSRRALATDVQRSGVIVVSYPSDAS